MTKQERKEIIVLKNQIRDYRLKIKILERELKKQNSSIIETKEIKKYIITKDDLENLLQSLNDRDYKEIFILNTEKVSRWGENNRIYEALNLAQPSAWYECNGRTRDFGKREIL